MNNQYIMVFCTVTQYETAVHIAKELVNSKLAACVNIIPKMYSIYLWENKTQTAEEVLCIIKTKTANYSQVEQTIKTLHNYTCPEIIACDITHGLDKYLQWIDSICN